MGEQHHMLTLKQDWLVCLDMCSRSLPGKEVQERPSTASLAEPSKGPAVHPSPSPSPVTCWAFIPVPSKGC